MALIGGIMEESIDFLTVPAGTDFRKEAEKNFWSNLKWHSLFCLLEHKGHLPISELAKKVGLNVNQAVLALESMEIIGLIKKTNSGYAQVNDYFNRVSDKKNHVDIMTQFVLSSSQVNNRILETVTSSELHKTKCITYNSNKALAAELFSKIQMAIDEFKLKSNSAKESWDGIYNLSASLIEMTGEA